MHHSVEKIGAAKAQAYYAAAAAIQEEQEEPRLLQHTRKRELEATLSHRLEQKDFAGAAAVQHLINTIGDSGMTHGVPDDDAGGAAAQAGALRNGSRVPKAPGRMHISRHRPAEDRGAATGFRISLS